VFSVFLYEPLNPMELTSPGPPAVLKPNGVKPELGGIVSPFNVNMGWLISVTYVEEKPVRASS